MDASDPFPAVWERFEEFMHTHGLLDSHEMNTHLFVTCGDWDLKTMLPNQMQLAQVKHGLDKQGRAIVPYNRWLNIKRPFKTFTKTPSPLRIGMAGMLKALQLELIGRHHSGIDDAKNILRIVEKMREGGWDPSTAPISGVTGQS